MSPASAPPGLGQRAVAQSRRVPDFFVVGHPKSGTTALHGMLAAHPQIQMAAEKEPWFFSAAELRHRAPPREPVGIPATLDEYLALFDGATPEQRLGDASTTYLWSPTAAAAIAAVCPDARIVALLREPASFLRSLHLQFVEAHIEVEHDFASALALEPERRAGRGIPEHSYWPQLLLYSEHVRYAEQLNRYRDAFAPEQILVLVYEDFKRDNEATLRRLLRFLGVDDRLAIAEVRANPTVRPRSRALHEAVHAISVGRGPISRTAKRSIKRLVPTRARRAALDSFRRRVLYADAAAADAREQAALLELRRRFRGEVQAVSGLLGRDLAKEWGYDRID